MLRGCVVCQHSMMGACTGNAEWPHRAGPLGPQPRPIIRPHLGPVWPAHLRPRDVRPKSTIGAHLLGWFRSPYFRSATQRVIAGEAVAAFKGLSYDDEADIHVSSGVSVFDKVRANFGSYGSYHRASNRWYKRLETLRSLREELLFESADIRRVRSPTNEQWVGLNARKVVSKRVENGGIESRHAHWYKSALVEVFFLKDDDDSFFEALRTTCATCD